MKKLVYGILALTFVFTVSLSLNAQTDGTQKVPQTQEVEKKKECKTTCDKTAKKECTGEAKKECTGEAKKECTGEAKKECTGEAKKECCKKK